MLWRCSCGIHRPESMPLCRWCGDSAPGAVSFRPEERARLLALRHRVQSGDLWGDTRGYFEARLEWLAWLWERGLA